MTISLKHAFTSPVTDDGDPNEVGPNEWNAEHNLTMTADRLLGRLSTDGAVQELTAAQTKALLAILGSDVTGADLTKTDDTNVTLTLGGTPTGALLKATSITVGWTGTLAAARLNSNVVQSVVNDTNIQGSIANQTLTFTWSGQLPATRGGTGFGAWTVGDILYADSTSTLAKLNAGTSGYAFIANGAGAAPSYQGFVQEGTGAVTRTWQAKARDAVSVKDFGALGDDSNDDTAEIQAAIDTGKKYIVVPAGTYRVSSTIVLQSGQILQGVGPGGSILKWTGSNSSTVVRLPSQASHGGVCDLTIDAQTATGMTGLHLVDAQTNVINNLRFLRTGASSSSGIAIRLQAGSGGTGSTFNCVNNHFRSIYTSDWAVGIQGDGISSGPTVVTLNHFYNLFLEDVTLGIRLAEWVDSNSFTNTRAQLTSSNSFGVVANDSATPGSDVGVYNNNFYGLLAVDAFTGSGHVGVRLNYSKQTYVETLYVSPDAFPGTVFEDNSGRSESHYVTLFNKGDSGNEIQTIAKGWTVLDSGFLLADESDDTKRAAFQLSSITTGNTRTLTVPDASGIIALNDNAATFSNKTIALGSNTVSGTKAQFDTAVTDDNFAYRASAQTFTAEQTINVTTPFPLTLISTDGLGNGLQYSMKHLPSSGGVGDKVLYLFNFKDSAGNEYNGGYFQLTQDDHTDGSEDTSYTFARMVAGALAQAFKIGAGLIVGASGTDPGVGALVASASIKSSGATSGIGYATGAGGTVTQGTSKSTGVTLNKATGQITMHNATLNAGAEVTFTLTNSAIAATDVVIVNHASAGTAGAYLVGVSAVGSGSCQITVANLSAGNLGEAIVLNFAVIKGVTS